MFNKKRYKHYRIILKNGAEFKVKSSGCTIQFDANMNLASYQLDNATGEVPFFLSPADISAILDIT